MNHPQHRKNRTSFYTTTTNTTNTTNNNTTNNHNNNTTTSNHKNTHNSSNQNIHLGRHFQEEETVEYKVFHRNGCSRNNPRFRLLLPWYLCFLSFSYHIVSQFYPNKEFRSAVQEEDEPFSNLIRPSCSNTNKRSKNNDDYPDLSSSTTGSPSYLQEEEMSEDLLVNSGKIIRNRFNPDRNPLLPSHSILVTGLESSGTKFVTAALAYAYGIVAPPKANVKNKLHNDRAMENFHGRVIGPNDSNHKKGVEIEHLSLPHGFWCTQDNVWEDLTAHENNLREVFLEWTEPVHVPIECVCHRDVINGFARESNQYGIKKSKVIKYPVGGECPMWKLTKKPKHEQHCNALGIESPKDIPRRTFFNVTSYVQWYQEKGTRATAVIVMREKSIGLLSKYNDHCLNKMYAKAENEYGLELIQHALQALTPPENSTIEEEVPSVILLSFELMTTLGEAYLQQALFSKLGLTNPKYIPPVYDANERYINHNFTKPKKANAHMKRKPEKDDKNDLEVQKMSDMKEQRSIHKQRNHQYVEGEGPYGEKRLARRQFLHDMARKRIEERLSPP